ncbi:MAG: cytochrome c3 family protein [Nitrospinae bacterium]|nr:cytochrome c3 family protein [Nitrospinota bacterium]
MFEDYSYKRYLYLFLLFWGLVLPTPSFADEETKISCVVCHSELNGPILEAVNQWKRSIHKNVGVTCADCHGGNPNSIENAMDKKAGFRGKPKVEDIPGLCANCHADAKKMRQYNIRVDQYVEYKTSIHGILLEKGDTNVATCVSCHGNHEIRKKNDPLSTVYHTNVPETCGKCHSDREKMRPYGIPINQLDDYKKSYHGQILYNKVKGKNPALAPNCADCHGIHGAIPPGVNEVVNVCGNCHTKTAGYYREGPHYQAMQEIGLPRCVDCHGNHNIQFPSVEMFTGKGRGECGGCHEEGSPPFKKGERVKELLVKAIRGIEEGEEEVKEIRYSGRNIDELLLDIDEARGMVTEAITITHTLDLERVKKLLDDSTKRIDEISYVAEKVRKDIKTRHRAFLSIITLILTIVTLLILKLRSLKGNPHTDLSRHKEG